MLLSVFFASRDNPFTRFQKLLFIVIDTFFVIFLTAMAHTIVVNNTYQCRELCTFEKGTSGWRKRKAYCKANFDWDKADPIDCGHESVREETFKSKSHIDDRAPYGDIDPEDKTGAELAELRNMW